MHFYDFGEGAVTNDATGNGSWKSNKWKGIINPWKCEADLRIDFIFNVDPLPNTDAMSMNTIRWLYGVGFFVTTIKNYKLFFDVFGG